MFAGIIKNLFKLEDEFEFKTALPVYSIEDNLIIFKNGRVAAGFQLFLPEVESQDSSQIADNQTVFGSFFNDLPVGTVVTKFDDYWDIPYKVEADDLKYLAKKQHQHFIDRPITAHRSFLFINFPTRNEKIKTNAFNSLFANNGKSILENPFDEIEERKYEAEAKASRVADSMSRTMDIAIDRLNGDHLEALIYSYFNLDSQNVKNGFEKAITNERNFVSVGETKANIVTMIGQGLEVLDVAPGIGSVQYSFTFPIHLGLQFPHIVVTSMEIRDTEKEIKKLELDKKANKNIIYGRRDEHEKKPAEIDEFISELRDNNYKAVGLSVSVIVHSISDYHRKKRLEAVKDAFKSMVGCIPFVEAIDTANLFFGLCPGNASETYRWLPVNNLVAGKYFNFATNYYSSLGGLPMTDRFGNPVNVQIPNPHLDSQNALIIGPTGSGKSFTMNFIIILRFLMRYVQIIIDKGGTYKGIITALRGTYYEYDPENPLSFNPFYVKKDSRGRYTPSLEKINYIVDLLGIIWKGNAENEGLNRSERAFFLKLVPLYFEHASKKDERPVFNRFYEWFQTFVKSNNLTPDMKRDLEFTDTNNFFSVTQLFYDGQYCKLLNNDEDIDISDSILTCFDVNKIQKNAILYPVVTFIITQLSLEQLAKFPDIWKFIYMDEVWSMLTGKMQDFIEEMYRTIRKLKGGIYIITQDYQDIKNSTAGAAIKGNSETKIILKHKDNTIIDGLCEYFGFTEHERSKIMSMRKLQGKREVYIHQAEVGKLYMLEAAKEIALLSSSKPDERNTLQRYLKKYKNIDLAVAQIFEDAEMKTGEFKEGGSNV